MKNKSKHLQKEERFFIEKMLKSGKGIIQIAKLLDRGVSTISEEVSRNGGVEGYSSNTAQIEAKNRQINKKLNHNRVIKNKKIKKLVDKFLIKGLSPESISDTLKIKSPLLYASPKSIRKYIKQTVVK